MTATVSLNAFRNVPFPPEVLTFSEGGAPRDFTGKTFAMDVRQVAGTGVALISLNTAPNGTANGVRAVDAAAGQLRIQIDQTTIASVYDAIATRAGEVVALVYDLLVIDSAGVPEAIIEGPFIIEPGVTL
ncbi:hypothetical protein [Brevundimonas sp. FT23028]|uniref:hypothetical protein n=1 Tax=Brevundimonas sp. FT23028 TaxID=3393748 RepID=UPI003B5864BE